MVTDYRIPFRALSASTDDSFDKDNRKKLGDPSEISLSFSFADSKRLGCQNLKLDEHGIELCIRRQKLTLPFNKSKALSIRVIKAVSPADQSLKENQMNTSSVSNSSNNSHSVRVSSRKRNKTALACLIGKPFIIDKITGQENLVTDKNFTFVLRLNY